MTGPLSTLILAAGHIRGTSLPGWNGNVAVAGHRDTFFRSLSGNMTPIVAASVSRQARLITRGVVLVTLAFSFAVSTAIFNTTYNVQSRVDAS